MSMSTNLKIFGSTVAIENKASYVCNVIINEFYEKEAVHAAEVAF